MNIVKIKETCLYVHDLDEARNFYHDVLGLPVISYLPGKHLFLRAGGSVLLCFNPEDSKTKKSPPAHYGEGRQHFAFEVPKENYERTKAEIKGKMEIKANVVYNDLEKSLIKLIYEFPAVVTESSKQYNPSHVANHVYELTKTFNRFYHDFSILKEVSADIKALRLALAAQCGTVIKNGMNLLGIQVPDKM